MHHLTQATLVRRHLHAVVVEHEAAQNVQRRYQLSRVASLLFNTYQSINKLRNIK